MLELLVEYTIRLDILIRVRSDFTTRLQAVLAIGIYIITNDAGEKM